MKNKTNKVERCKSKVTFLAYLDSHPWLRNETYYWTTDNKIKCQICDKIIPTASKMKQHSKGIKHKKKLVDCYKNRLPTIVYRAISISKEIASISNFGIVENVDIDKVNMEHVMIEKEETNQKDINVIEDFDYHNVLDVFNENVQVDEARSVVTLDDVEKASKEFLENKESNKRSTNEVMSGKAQNMKDCANALELIFRNIFNNINTIKLKYS